MRQVERMAMPGTPSGENHSDDNHTCGRNRQLARREIDVHLIDLWRDPAALDRQSQLGQFDVEQRFVRQVDPAGAEATGVGTGGVTVGRITAS
jgi:hypothetical protein